MIGIELRPFDLFRGLAIGAELLVCGLATLVAVRAWEREHKWRAVALLTWIGFILVAVVEQVERIGEPPTWRSPVGLTLAAIGVFALLKHHHQRV